MLATDFHLIPLAQLCKHEATVLARLDSLPTRYAKSLLEEPEVRYPFLYYALLTHWPELLGDLSAEEVFYNRYYWFLRMERRYRKNYDLEAGFENEARHWLKSSLAMYDSQVIEDIGRKIEQEFLTHQWELPVAYSEFSIAEVLKQFDLDLIENLDLFGETLPVTTSALLQETLKENVPFALAMGTEKARSEFIIAPVLSEIRRQLMSNVSVFSGVELNVDSANGLIGYCDFLLCRSPHQRILHAPILTVAEVKKMDPSAGIGQCVAEMVAARIFNQRNGTDIPILYGVVTTGSNWRFLRLINSTVYVDASEYYIKEVERIVGIIVSMFKSGVTV